MKTQDQFSPHGKETPWFVSPQSSALSFTGDRILPRQVRTQHDVSLELVTSQVRGLTKHPLDRYARPGRGVWSDLNSHLAVQGTQGSVRMPSKQLLSLPHVKGLRPHRTVRSSSLKMNFYRRYGTHQNVTALSGSPLSPAVVACLFSSEPAELDPEG